MKNHLIILLLLISNIGYNQTIIYLQHQEIITNKIDYWSSKEIVVAETVIETIILNCYLHIEKDDNFISYNFPVTMVYKGMNLATDNTETYYTGTRINKLKVNYREYLKPFSNFEPLVIIPKLYKRRSGA